jgi:uncharacterized membrane protein YqhA
VAVNALPGSLATPSGLEKRAWNWLYTRQGRQLSTVIRTTQGNHMLENALSNSRYLVVMTVVLSTGAAICLYIAATLSFVTVIVDYLAIWPWSPKIAKEAAIGFLNVIDLLLIAAGFQTIAFGVHQIFLDTNLEAPPGLKVETFDEMKVSLVKLIGLILMIMFLERAFIWESGMDIVYFGAAIAVVMITFTWSMIHGRRR